MYYKRKWLPVLALTLLLWPRPPAGAEETLFDAGVEVGAYGQKIDKDGSRVNEYSRQGNDDTLTGYGTADVRTARGNSAAEIAVDAVGGASPDARLQFDFGRILRVRAESMSFKHQLDHDRIDYLNAAVPGANLFATANPGAPVSIDITGAPAAATSIWSLSTDPSASLNPNNVPAFIGKDALGNWYATNLGTPPAAIAGNAVSWQQIGRASVYGEDFAAAQVFEIERRESKAETDLTLPFLPQVTFHAGYRLEEREGTEQSIGMSKCTACHVTGGSREVNEQTEDLSAGATGRFGLLTVDYGYKTSEFREKGADPTRRYDPALSPSPSTTYTPTNGTFDNRLLYDYEDGQMRYDVTPDSEKASHLLKARVDLPRATSLVGTLVRSESESHKSDEAGVFTLGDQTLTSNYDGYGLRLATKLTDALRLNLRGKVEKVETDASVITYLPMGTTAQPNLGGGVLPASITRTYESIENRDVLTLGADAVWRLARKTTLRFGYEYKSDERDDNHFGDTTTQTAEASLKVTLAKDLNARLSYTYQNIDNPLTHVNAAGYVDPVTGLPYTIDPTANAIGNGPLYGTAFYDQRQVDLSNLPEEVHETKAAATWSPDPRYSMTAALRYRDESNDLDRSEWQQQTVSPSLSFWYAPAQKLNLTFVYNYLGQKAESRFCQGWYDG